MAIPRYEVLRIVPDDADDTNQALPPPAPVEASAAPFYVATRNGAAVRATSVGTKGSEVRVSTSEGSLTFHRTDLVGVLRVPAPRAAGGVDHDLGPAGGAKRRGRRALERDPRPTPRRSP